MCGRFVIDDDGNLVQAEFGLSQAPQQTPRYNVAPTQKVLAIGLKRDGSRSTSRFSWGLVPSWAKDKKSASKLINARSETVDSKPSFREAFKKRRCIVPMSGYYEWQKDAEGNKQPVYIHAPAGRLFGVAGLWEIWRDEQEEKHYSCTILTTEANELTAPIHHRMPVILPPSHYEAWLDLKTADETLTQLFNPYDPNEMAFYQVSRQVNKVSFDEAACIAPLASA